MSHTYEKDGKILQSVTTIIGECVGKQALTQWASNQAVDCIVDNFRTDVFTGRLSSNLEAEARYKHKDALKHASDIGTETHLAIEKYWKGKTSDGLSPEANTAFGAFLDWVSFNNVQPLGTEEVVYGNGWAGTADFICKLNKKMTIIDWKTSKNHYKDSHGPQIAAYRSKIAGIQRSLVVRLDKLTGLFDEKDYSRKHEVDLKRFRHMVAQYYLYHPVLAKRSGWEERFKYEF